MRSVYTLNLHLPMPDSREKIERWFPSGTPELPDGYFRRLEDPQNDSDLWQVFDPIFINARALELLRWGAVSIIKEERGRTDAMVAPTYRYLWRYWLLTNSEHDHSELSKFVADANRPNAKMVLPAMLAEDAFASLSEFQLKPKCVVVLPDEAEIPESEDFIVTARGKLLGAPEAWFPGEPLKSYNPAGWQLYVDRLAAIAD